MNSTEIAQVVEPFEEGFSEIFRLAWTAVNRTVPDLGVPTKVERANCMHQAVRSRMRPFCEVLSPILELVEEPDGQGKDYVVIDFGESKSLTLCWGRFGNGEIRRSQTLRNQVIQEQGYFPFAEDDTLGAMRVTATIGYEVADDFTEGSKPCWWIQRLVLVRERHGESEFIKSVYVYEKPEEIEVVAEDFDVGLIREKERSQLERIAEKLRRKLS